MIHAKTEPFSGEHTGIDYKVVLSWITTRLRPRTYLEIGTSGGDSLRGIDVDTIAIDPTFDLRGNVLGRKRVLHLFQMTSDEFFAAHSPTAILGRPIDVAFLDGLHRLEFLLRDLINVERHCHPGSLVLLHDCLPVNTRMAVREEVVRDAWAGDVWLLLPALHKFRADLRVVLFDCPPTGLVAVTRLDPANELLARNYHAILDEFVGLSLSEFGFERLMGLYPMISTKALEAHPEDLSAVLSATSLGATRILDTPATPR